MTDIDVSAMLEKVWPGWKVVRLIGEGAYGKVYEIQKTDFGEAFSAALKVITIPNESNGLGSYRSNMSDVDITEYYESVTENLMREYHIMSKLRGNSNIVSYEDHIRIPFDEGIGWNILIRMELLTTLGSYVYSSGMSRQDVIKLGIDICKALELCRKYKVIHRDIKPENIFISEFGNYKLGDFGVARTMEKTQGLLSKQGTSMYMAPEVYANRPYGASVDIYSLGLVMYQYMNNNRAPFIAEKLTYKTQTEALSRRMNGEALPSPSGEKGPLAEIVLKACSFDPDERYSDPQEMRQALESLVDIADRKNYLFPNNVTPGPNIQVRFLDEDKSVINRKSYFEDESLEIPPDPVKPDSNGFRYVFTGWSPAVNTQAKEDVDYTACYRKEKITVTMPEQKKDKKPVFIAAGALVLVLAAVIIIVAGHGSRSGNEAEISSDGGSAVSQGYDDELDWSDWAEELPDSVNAENYVVEEKLQYRTAPILRCNASNEAPADYTLRYTLYGDYGDWSEWQEQTQEPAAGDTCDVDSRTVYRYKTLYSAQQGNSFHTATTTSYYWSNWYYSDKPVSASSTVKVEEIQEYRQRERAAIFCFCRDSDWSEFSDTPDYPSASEAVNTRRLYRYALRDGVTDGSPSMDNFPKLPDDYSGRFTDVDDDKWYGGNNSDCIAAVTEIGAITADDYMMFRPDDNLTLAEAVKAAVTVNRIYNGETGILPESPVWYQVYVDYAIQNGIISAEDFSDFTADASREETAYIMHNALPLSELPGVNIVTEITDMDIGSQYYMSVYQLAQAGIISWATPENCFNADKTITRAEAAAIVERMISPETRIVNG